MAADTEADTDNTGDGSGSNGSAEGLDASVHLPFSPLQIGPIRIKNRFIRSAANENMSRDGLPAPAMLKMHSDLAAGGVGLTTLAYVAVAERGRTLPDQLWMRPQAVPYLRVLTDAVHRHGAKIAAQITHGGSFVTGIRLKGFTRSASAGFNTAGLLAGNFWHVAMNEADMEQVQAQFVQTAVFAREAGFDAVELHMGHGYLLNQFVSPLSNKRRDRYGGSAQNRVRFPAQVLAAVKAAVGDDLAVIAKINVADGVPGGATAADGIVTARALQAAGADLLVLSGGRNVESLSFMFGSNTNVAELKKVLHDRWLTRTAIALNSRSEKKVHFQPMYLWQYSQQIRQAVPDMPMAYLGGVKSLDNVQQALEGGFAAVAMARVLLHNPHFVNDLQQGKVVVSDCDNCNGCVASIYHPDGTRCIYQPPNDPSLNRQALVLPL